jgi:hypothetical protein
MEGSVLSFLKAEWKVSDTGCPEENLFLRISQLETRLPIAAICQLAQNEKDLLSTSKWTETWWEAPMEGSVLSFLKAEWKMSDTGWAHWASS